MYTIIRNIAVLSGCHGADRPEATANMASILWRVILLSVSFMMFAAARGFCMGAPVGVSAPAHLLSAFESGDTAGYDEKTLFVPSSAIDRDTTFRVGLVLSGGGAKGIAHAGVIKALEENGIPVSCIAGTSMGAIVGSLYACGYSPDEMMALFTSKGFRYWSTGTVNRNLTYYFSTPAPTPEWLSINLNLRDTANNITSQIIPSSLISPIPMNMEFMRLYAPYTEQCGGDFNRLFVPLRTVCSDVYHKRKIVCYKGSLGDAVRASMSFPLVFKPIELDGVLVYDGGIYDNFPVDVMEQDFNPDFVIGVSVSGPDSKPQAGNVYSQLEDMIIQNNNYTVPDSIGIKIQVPVLQFGVLDFDKADVIYEIGYRTGLSMVDSIKSRCHSRVSPSEVAARRARFRTRTPEVIFDSVAVEGATPRQSRYLVNLFEGGLENARRRRRFGMSQVEKAYYRAVTDGKLNDLLPQAEFGENGNNTLLLKADVKNPWKVGVGGWITSSIQSMLYVTLGYHTLSLNSLDVDISGWLGQSYYAGMLSGSIVLPSEKPSSLGLSAVWSRQKYYDTELMFYQDGTPAFINATQGFVRGEYRVATSTRSVARAMLTTGIMEDSYYPYNTPALAGQKKDRTRYRAVALRLGWERNTLDNQLYPMEGQMFDASLTGVFEGSKFRAGNATGNGLPETGYKGHWGLSGGVVWKNFYRLSDSFTVGACVDGLVTLQKLYQDYTATLIHAAAFAPTPSTRNYFNVAFRSDNYLAAGVIPVWNPVGKLQVRGDFYVYSPIRNLRDTPGVCSYDGWFRKAEFIGEVAAVYNFSFASLSLYCNYLSYPARNWNFGINFGLFFNAPRFIR